jgi:tripartite-type tricarboxylate transporter receptor subunit TctC
MDGAWEMVDYLKIKKFKPGEEKTMGQGKILLRTIAIAAALTFAVAAYAQTNYPTRTIRILVGFTPGSASDLTARLVASDMSKTLGQQVIIENKPGAGATIAATEAARAPNDGYTLFLTSSAIAANAAFMNLKFDMKKDFAAIAPVNEVPLILAVNPSLGVKTVGDLVKLAKSKPGELTYGSPGVGTGSHLGPELFNVRAGVKIRQVSYRGSPEAVNDVLAGRTSLIFSPSAVVLPHVQGGRLVALASGGTRRAGVTPNLPTMMESGVPDFDVSTWFGLVAPAGTPKPIVDKLAQAVNAALKSEGVRAGFKAQGFDALGGSPEEFEAFIDRELKKWAAAAAAAGLKRP